MGQVVSGLQKMSVREDPPKSGPWRQAMIFGFAGLLATFAVVGALYLPLGGNGVFVPGSANSRISVSGAPAPSFDLTNQFGKRVTLDQLRGQVVVLVFQSAAANASSIPAAVIRDAQKQLGHSPVTWLAINTDPFSASIADVAQFSQHERMLNRWQFLTGSYPNLLAIWHAYQIDVAVEGRSVQYTSAVYVIDRSGHERQVFLLNLQNANLVREEAQKLVQEVQTALNLR